MGMIYRFEDLVVWQEARALCKMVYDLCQDNRDYDYRSQIQRASVSIMNNIAEGFDRNKIDETNKSFIYFLDISYGSCGEVRSMTYIGEDIGILSHEQANDIRIRCASISSKLYALIEMLKANPKPARRQDK